MIGLGHGRGQVQHIAIGGTRDGRVPAYRVGGPPGRRRLPAHGRVPAVHDPHHAHRHLRHRRRPSSTRAPCSPTRCRRFAYRGAGRPEAAAAIERAMDLFAAEIGMDPIEVRRRNLVAS